jgi:hypothetical protein
MDSTNNVKVIKKKMPLIPILVEDTIFFIDKINSYDYAYKLDVTRYKKKENCFYMDRYNLAQDVVNDKKFYQKYPLIEVQGILYNIYLSDEGRIKADPV